LVHPNGAESSISALIPEGETEDLAQTAAGVECTAVTIEDLRFEVLAGNGTMIESPPSGHEDVLEAVAGNHTGPRGRVYGAPGSSSAGT
jgi:hypothetical protein